MNKWQKIDSELREKRERQQEKLKLEEQRRIDISRKVDHCEFRRIGGYLYASARCINPERELPFNWRNQYNYADCVEGDCPELFTKKKQTVPTDRGSEMKAYIVCSETNYNLMVHVVNVNNEEGEEEAIKLALEAGAWEGCEAHLLDSKTHGAVYNE